MDLLQDIKQKSSALEGHSTLDGVNAVIRHIQVAERYLSQGRTANEEDLFNDVIYRTNQAFEGILKEAYTVLTSRDGSTLSPNQIEQHLLQEKVLASRVLELFKNYRQNWRNPSTHDHKLFFGEQEALLAIVSVSAFANILLDQVIEAINYKQEQERVKESGEKLREAADRLDAMNFPQLVVELMKMFEDVSIVTHTNLNELTEVEIIGRLHGYIEALDPTISVINNPRIPSSDSVLYADLILKKSNEEDVIVEVKRSGMNKSMISRGTAQLLSYLGAAGTKHGVLYIPSGMASESGIKTLKMTNNGREVQIHYVVPSNLL